jgi:cardiolipin synthase A/B
LGDRDIRTIERQPSLTALRDFAERALSRAAGTPPTGGNTVRLLKDARENYPAWLDAIRRAKRHIHFESYIIHEDDTGWEFAAALMEKAAQGVRVRIVYDWLGAIGNTSRRFWNRLREGGVEVRCYNPPRLDSPLGWLSRDHRKMLAVDSEVAFITGLCVGKMWVGNPAKKIEPWRDTGIEVSGSAVAEVERAFAEIWSMVGDPIPEEELTGVPAARPEGDVTLHIIATLPITAGMLRLDELVAALARKRLWLTDAYYAGTTTFVQALRAAAKDGVDVRLLVPNGTDIPLIRPFSRAGYRLLLEAGIRVFEWNGAMMHAKTAVADGRWSRVGSSNLNIASWFANCELDAFIMNEPFAREMEEMYLEDLTNSTEVVLDKRRRVRSPGEPPRSAPPRARSGSAGRAAAGAIRVGNAIGAAFTNRRVLEPVEARLMFTIGALLLGLTILFILFPGVLVYPVIVLFTWIGVTLLFRALRLQWKRGRHADRNESSAKRGGRCN